MVDWLIMLQTTRHIPDCHLSPKHRPCCFCEPDAVSRLHVSHHLLRPLSTAKQVRDRRKIHKKEQSNDVKITSGYLCVNCDEIPNFIHKIIFRGNNQNIVYWKLHVFSYPTLLKQTVQKNLIPTGYIEGETAPGEVRHRRIDSVHFITSRHVPSPTLAWILTACKPPMASYIRGHLHNVMHLIATLPAQSVPVYTQWCDRHCRVTGACPSIPITSIKYMSRDIRVHNVRFAFCNLDTNKALTVGRWLPPTRGTRQRHARDQSAQDSTQRPSVAAVT